MYELEEILLYIHLDAHCEATDGRGVLWSADVNTTASKPCDVGDGEASWFCDSAGNFVGQQPDRLQCVDDTDWISKANDDIMDYDYDYTYDNSISMTSEEISEFILENIEAETKANVGPTGGDLKRLIESFSSLLEKRNLEPKDDGKGNFTKNMLESVSILSGLEVGWNEIQEEGTRFQTSSNMLTIIDDLGFSFSEKIDTKDCEDHDFKFRQVDSLLY